MKPFIDAIRGDGHVHVPFIDGALEGTIRCALEKGIDFFVVAERDVPWKDNKSHYEMLLEKIAEGANPLGEGYNLRVLDDGNHMIQASNSERKVYVIRGEEIKTVQNDRTVDVLAWGIGARIDANIGGRFRSVSEIVEEIYRQDAIPIIPHAGGLARGLYNGSERSLDSLYGYLEMVRQGRPMFLEHNLAPWLIVGGDNKSAKKLNEMSHRRATGFQLVGGSDAHAPAGVMDCFSMMVGPDKKQIFQNERYGQNVLKFLVEYIIKGDVSLQRQHANPLVFALQYVWYRSSCR